MPAILGIRGSGSFSADERPKNWRELILYLFPNGEAPLTAIMSLLKSEGTSDPEFNWWDKRLQLQRMTVVGAQTNVDTAIEVVSGAKDAVKGTILLVELTGELLRVTTDPTTDTALTVERSWGTVVAGSMVDGQFMTIVGNVHEEGTGVPTARAYSPVKRNNYTQIFRTSFFLTRTARRTRLRWDATGPYREAKREALSLHSIEMEKGFIWGDPVEVTGADLGMPMRSTGGVLSFLTTNRPGGTENTTFAVNGPLTEVKLDAICELIFRYGNNEKLALCGSTFLGAVSSIAKMKGTINITPTSDTYGMKIVEWRSPFGTLMFKLHPLFSQHPGWRGDALIVDTSNLIYRALDDTRLIKNRQNPGDDASKDEFLTECGLELHFEETHGYVKGVTGAA